MKYILLPLLFLVGLSSCVVSERKYELILEENRILKEENKKLPKDKETTNNDIEGQVSRIDKYAGYILHIGGDGSRLTEKTASYIGEHGYLNPPGQWITTSFNSPADVMWVKCREEYLISACKSDNEIIYTNKNTCGLILETKLQNKINFECHK